MDTDVFDDSRDQDDLALESGPLPSLNNNLYQDRIAFLAQYRDFHAFFAQGQRFEAAKQLVSLLRSGLAPTRFYAVMLLDTVPLLQGA